MPYYVISEDKKGNPCQFGPYAHNWEAEDVKERREQEGRPAEVRFLRTRNADTATRLIKEGRIEKEGLDEGSRRMRHPSVNEERG